MNGSHHLADPVQSSHSINVESSSPGKDSGSEQEDAASVRAK